MINFDSFIEFFSDVGLRLFDFYKSIGVTLNGNTFSLLVALFAFRIFDIIWIRFFGLDK